MATHILPHPATPVAVRPSTARSTVRAVTPSPPHTAYIAALDFAPQSPGHMAESLLFASYSTPDIAEGNEDSGSETKPPAKITDFPASRTKIPECGLQRGGIASRASSPMKSRPVSPLRSRRPSLTPSRRFSLQEHLYHGSKRSSMSDGTQRRAGKQRAVDGKEDSRDTYSRPGTPTPMSKSQRHSSYIPLGAPLDFWSADVTSAAKRRLGSTDGRGAMTEAIGSPGPSSLQAASYTLPSPPRAQNHKQQKKENRPLPAVPGSCRTSAPLPVFTKNSAVVIPRKALPFPTPNTHSYVATQSSSNSGDTIHSRRSIFRTLGRDEFERKKALVEPDEGPFANTVSLIDLRERRRQVSDEYANGKQRTEKGAFCGMRLGRGGCCIM